METLLYGRATGTLGQEHFAKLRMALQKVILRIIGFHRRQCTDHVMSYSKDLKKEQCESTEMTIRKRRLLFAGAVQRTINEGLIHRMMFGTIACGENPGSGRPEKNWAQCLTDDLRGFQATEGSTESSPLLFGVETVLWPKAAKESGKWYRGAVEAAGCFMVRWHRDEAQRSREESAAPRSCGRRERRPGRAGCTTQLRMPRTATRGGEEGGRAAVLIQLSTNVETK